MAASKEKGNNPKQNPSNELVTSYNCLMVESRQKEKTQKNPSNEVITSHVSHNHLTYRGKENKQKQNPLNEPYPRKTLDIFKTNQHHSTIVDSTLL